MESIKNIIYSNDFSLTQDELEIFESYKYIYKIAEGLLNTYLHVIKSEYDREKVHGDIQFITSRIKSLDSIAIKLNNDGLDFNLMNINNINDIVGARIVCVDLDDVNRTIEMIKTMPNIKVTNEKDYINDPKESGYRSYHFICEIEVPVDNVMIPVKAEIQVRTLLMDAWSSLEHEIIYKNKNCSEESKKELLVFSHELAALENSMMIIRNKEINKRKQQSQRKIKKANKEAFNDYSYVYDLAADILNNYIEIVKSKYYMNDNNSSIQKPTTPRIKSIDSIDRKLAKKDLEFNLYNISENIKDIVLSRIICLDLDDVNEMVNIIKNTPIINIVQEKDYITNPKKSGYRAHHLIVEVPVELSSGVIPVRCEIQVRTVLMDAWSSLEHEIIYKNENCSEQSKTMLRDYSYLLASMDDTMLKIKRYEVENLLNLNNHNNENVKVLSKSPKKG